MTKKISTTLVLICTLVVFLSSCKKDNEPSIYVPTEVDSTKIVALNYADFIFADDVNSVNDAKTSFLVKKDYLKKINEEINVANVVSVWTASNTLPFYIRVSNIVDKGTEFEIYGSEASIAEVLSDVDLVLNTSPYYNPNPSTKARTKAEELGVDPSLIGENGDVHPAIVISSKETLLQPDASKLNYTKAFSMTKGGEEEFYVFDIREQGANASTELKIGFKKDFDIKINGRTEKDTLLRYHGTFKTSFGARISLDIGLFSLGKFEGVFFGKYDLDSKLGLKMDDDLPFGDTDFVELMQINSYWAIFAIGPIPVTVELKPSIVKKTGGKASAELSLGLPVRFKGEFKAGLGYDKNKDGWHIIKEFKDESEPISLTNLELLAKIELEAEAGVYFKGGTYLYGLIGPAAIIGPNLKTEVSASLANFNELEIEAKAKLAVTAAAQAEFKVWKWTLGKYTTSFDLFAFELFKEKWKKTLGGE